MTALRAEEFFRTEVAGPAGDVFAAALALHIAAGLSCVVAGAIAATAGKRPGRHPRAGTVYYAGLTAVFVTATAMAVIRWAHNWHLFVIAVLGYTAGTAGYLGRRGPGASASGNPPASPASSAVQRPSRSSARIRFRSGAGPTSRAATSSR
jgi:hypothetical protein